MIEILYYAFIFPLQSVLGFALESLFGAIKSYGLSIIFLSLIINLILLKLSKIAEAKAHKTNALKARCDSKIAEFKRVFKGAELQSYIRTLYKQRHYHPIFALSALGGLALQVPFFIAILFLLQDFEAIKGESFLWISDLSAPDSVGGIHLLPILMTIISLLNVWIVAKDRGAKIQGIIIAIIFLVLLYQMPSALVLYWTTNMAFSLIRALVNSSLGASFALGEKFGRLTDSKSSFAPKFFTKHKTSTANTRIVELDSESSLRESRSDSWQSKNSPSLAEGVRGWVKSFFIFRKPLKIAVITLTVILAIGLCATFSLMIYAKDNVQTAPLLFDWDNKARIHFGKWDFLLRSSSISNVKLVDIAWDKAIDSSNIKVTSNSRRFVYFEYLDLEKGTNLGQISYIMNFTPLMQNLFRYYFAILGAVLGIYLLICVILRFQPYHEFYTQIYRKISHYAILCIAFLICVFTPYQLYSTDITQFDSMQTYFTLSTLFGAFVLVSFVAIYAISFIPKRFSNFTAFILSLILFSGIVYSFILVGDYGAMDHFLLQRAPESGVIQIFEFIAVLTLGIALVAFSLKKLIRVWQIVLLTLFIVSGVNAFQIIDKRMESAKVAQENNIRHSERSVSEAKNPSQNNADILDSSATKSPQNDEVVKPPYENELFSYSKTDKNIVVLVLDMFNGSHTPYILEQFSQFREQLDGFTLFPNTLTTTNATAHSITTVIAGEYYTVYNMNTRKQNLVNEVSKAFTNIGETFVDNGFSVGYMAYVHGNLINNPKINIIRNYNYKNFESYFIAKYNLNNQIESYRAKTKHYELLDLISFGLFKFTPEWYFRKKIYNNAMWLYEKIQNLFSVINHISSIYAPTHILNADSTKPTFKYFHTLITHFPYAMYFNNDNKECEFGTKSALDYHPRKQQLKRIYEHDTMIKSFAYLHYDSEVCALKYVVDYLESLKNLGIYDNTQIFIVSDHGGDDSMGTPAYTNRPDALLLFKDFNSKGTLKIDNRLMANYDISSIFCENLPNGCPNVRTNILKNYPKNREVIYTIPYHWVLKSHKSNEWLITKAYKVKDNIYDPKNWTDITDTSDIANVKE